MPGVRRSAPQGTLDACSVLSCGMTPHSTLDRPPWYCRGRYFVLRCRIRTPGLRIVRASGHQDFFEETQTMANTPHPIRDRRALHNHLKLFFSSRMPKPHVGRNTRRTSPEHRQLGWTPPLCASAARTCGPSATCGSANPQDNVSRNSFADSSAEINTKCVEPLLWSTAR